MPTRPRPYRPDDFMRVRDMLSETFHAFPTPVNWRIERWNYARYLVAPYLAPKWETNRTPAESDRSVRLLEGLIRVWEEPSGRIVAVVL
ncbi:MAG: hypothetical protein FJX72_21855, partial [Armatimonadetes bacterium]|nr:hypothetical protein [Armatimonadota bacterium]